MPSLLKDGPGRLGRLISALRPARAGPLPVQTGFPTSLADLFVQNHGRLKKQGPSSYAPATYRNKRRGAPALPSPPPSPAPSPPPPSPPPSPPPAVCPPSTQPGLDLPRAESVCHPGGRASGLGLGFLALVGVVSLALLVIWSRKVVAAVTVAAFLLVLLESVRASSLDRRPRPRPPATKELDIDGRGYVSPIREVEAEPEPPGSSFSDSGREIHAPILCIEERSEVGEDSCNWEAKPRKRSPWKKLIPRKLQRGRRIGKESDSLSSSFRSEVSQADSTLGGNARATDSPDSRRGRRNQANAKAEAAAKSPDSSGPLRGMGNAAAKSPDSSGPLRGKGNGQVRNNVAPMEIDEPASLAGVDDVGGGGSRFPLVAVIVVVLVGLVAGRLPAVAFTVLWFVLVCSLQRLSWDGRRLELSMA